MAHGFLAFIDESGSEGPIDVPGGFEFIVISAVVVRVANLQFLHELFDRFRRMTGKHPCWPVPKFIKMNSDTNKYLLANLIAKLPLRVCTIIAHKPSLTDEHMHTDHGTLYFFLSQLLVERISWICRDAHKRAPSGDGTPRIIFSERQSLRYDRFVHYARQIASNRSKYASRAAWDYIDLDNIVAHDHKNCEGLRIADFVASAFGRAIEYKQHGISDCRFVQPLSDVIYRPENGKSLNNGLKIFPNECADALLSEHRFDWFRNHFKK